jgi:hypothetical protein
MNKNQLLKTILLILLISFQRSSLGQSISLINGNSNSIGCIETSIQDIVYMIGNGATGAMISSGSLPIGVNGNFDSGSQTFTISGTPIQSGNFNYEISTTGGNNPSQTLNGNIVINELPQVNIFFSDSTCEGSDFEISFTPINYSIGVHNWIGPNNLTSVNSTLNFTNASSNLDGTYYLEVNVNGCSNQFPIEVEIHPLPIVSATSNSPICIGDTLILSGSNVSNNNYTIWIGPNGYTGVNDTIFQPNATPNFSGTYTFTIKDDNGCLNTANTEVLVNCNSTNNLHAYAIPSSTSEDGVCDGTVEIIVIDGTAPYQYSGTPSGGSSAQNLCSGLYSIIITDANQNSTGFAFIIPSPSTIYTNNNYLDSTIINNLYNNAIANCTVDYSSIDSSYISSFQLTPADSVTVNWIIYSGGSSTIQQIIYPLDNPNGVYELSMQIYCPNKSTNQDFTAYDRIYVDQNSIETVINPRLQTVYPNPFQNIIQINLVKETTVYLYDVNGKLILEEKLANQCNTLNTSFLETGTYFLKIGLTSYLLIKE